MSAPLNKKITYAAGVGAKAWFPLNRWGPSNYTITIIKTGTVSINVEGTVVQLNRGDTIAAGDVFTLPSGATITANTSFGVSDLPLEAIRVNQTSGTGTVSMHIMQAGQTDHAR